LWLSRNGDGVKEWQRHVREEYLLIFFWDCFMRKRTRVTFSSRRIGGFDPGTLSLLFNKAKILFIIIMERVVSFLETSW
jgi:hypothetical protein